MNDVIVDICGTLFSSNTTFDFVKWLHKDSRKYSVFVYIYHTKVWRALNRLSKRWFDVDLTRNLIVYQLKGLSCEQLEYLAKEFYYDYLINKINNEVYSIIQNYEKEGKNLIIVSATIYPLAKEIASNFNIEEFYATELFFEGNKCNGKIKNDLLGKKKRVLKNKQPWACITDDFSDEELLKMAKEQIIVVYPQTAYRWNLKCKKELEKAHKVYIKNRLTY